MLYYYADADGQTCGPVPVGALHAAIHEGTLTPETLAAEAGGSEWKPLAALLRYYYAADGAVLCPVRLADLPALAAARGHDLPVLPEGAASWLPVAAVLRLAAPQFVRMPVKIARPGPEESARAVKGLYMPDSAKAAGVIWFVFGLLKIIDCLVMMGRLSNVPVFARDIVILVWAISLVVAVIFLRAGLRTCSGAARGTLGNGLGSLGLGMMAGFSAARSWVLDDTFTSAVMTASAAALLIAGLLAIHAHQPYRVWRNAPRRR